MDRWGEDVEHAYERWSEEKNAATKDSFRRDRRCAHYAEGVPAQAYAGEVYLGALQRLRGSDAARAARNVEPFFWADAKVVRVWLCRDCAKTVGLG